MKIILIVCILTFCLTLYSAETLECYYAHKTVEDEFGVIAPWAKGQNGILDTRLRIAVEAMKRYPWVDSDKAVMAAPDFIYNSHWSIKDDGTILIPPTNNWMCGDLSQRAWSIIKGMTDYYRYNSDPLAFVYIPLIADYILDYAQTPAEADWPEFPIATPTKGKAYGKCNPNARNQLDLCAITGTEILRAYKLTGNKRYLNAAKHWADVFADKCNLEPSMPPWNRYTNPEVVEWSDELTASTTLIIEFLDELIRLGYTGEDKAIVKARDAGRRYINTLLDEWLKNDTWARNYWDWDNPVMCGIVSMCGDYIIKNHRYFPNWKTDLRNILTLIFNRNGVDGNSHGEVYSGAWAFPESCTCCGTSLSYNQYTAGPTLLHYGRIARNGRIFEIGRRMMIMAAYDSKENGVVRDGIFGKSVATGEWSNLAHPWPLCQIMEALKWTPRIFAPERENHILRTTSVVNNVIYEKNKIQYSTFDTPIKSIDLLRISFEPDKILGNNVQLKNNPIISKNGYTLKKLSCGDYILKIRHDGYKNITITSQNDPQQQIDDSDLNYKGEWKKNKNDKSYNNTLHTSSKKNASVGFIFSGNQVRIFGKVDTKGGLANVYIDGEKQLTHIDCWNPKTRHKQLLYYKNGLKNKEHALKIEILAKSNPLSNGNNIYIDSIQLSDQSSDNYFGQDCGPTNTQRMIFGYPKRNDYIDNDGNYWRPATEWIIQSGYGTDSVKEAWWTERRSMYIGNTKDQELYRYGVHGKEFTINLTAGQGEYYLILKFADTPLHTFLERNKKGGRITHTVSISVNDKKVVNNMNIAEYAGGIFKAADKVIKNIKPKNGIIEVSLKGCDEYGAIIQALELGLMSDLNKN